jgi:hypothetical protein
MPDDVERAQGNSPAVTRAIRIWRSHSLTCFAPHVAAGRVRCEVAALR